MVLVSAVRSASVASSVDTAEWLSQSKTSAGGTDDSAAGKVDALGNTHVLRYYRHLILTSFLDHSFISNISNIYIAPLQED